jgi:GNAT superfamily N-acetyltransferase
VDTDAANIEVRDATPDRWADVVTVFDGPGDPGRCWCQWFFRGAQADHAHADANREALQRQVQQRPPGVLAYLDGAPSGWCAVAPRPGYTRLTRSQLLRGTPQEQLADDAVWAVTCFVVRRGARRQGLAGPLLEGAVQLARRGGATVVEGYPVDVARSRRRSAAELYHGPLQVFLRAGFTEVGRPSPDRPVVRRSIAGRGDGPPGGRRASVVPNPCRGKSRSAR